MTHTHEVAQISRIRKCKRNVLELNLSSLDGTLARLRGRQLVAELLGEVGVLADLVFARKFHVGFEFCGYKVLNSKFILRDATGRGSVKKLF